MAKTQCHFCAKVLTRAVFILVMGPSLQQDIRTMIRTMIDETNFLCTNDLPMSSPSLVKLDPRIPENRLSVVPHP